MEHLEFMTIVDHTLGKPVNYGMLAKLTKIYTHEFIIECANKVPDRVKKQTPTQKMRYLNGICRSRATAQDFLNKNEIELDGFK